MTTATKPLPAHGTYARSVGRPSSGVAGCTCDLCVRARRAYKNRRHVLQETGRSLTIDAAPAASRLRQFFADGADWAGIQAATGCSASTISHLIAGRQTRILRSTAARILAVRLPQLATLPDETPAIGSIRRVRVLMAEGHCSVEIAAAVGCHESSVQVLLGGRRTTVRRRIHEAVARAYEEFADRPGLNERARRRAAKEGWPGRAEWDDDALDVPEEEPEVAVRTAVADALAGEVMPLTKPQALDVAQRMTLRGDTAEAIAHVIGRTSRTVVRWRTANGWKAAA